MIRARSARLRRVVAARTHAVSCARSCAATANLVATAMPCLHHAITGMASELTRRDTRSGGLLKLLKGQNDTLSIAWVGVGKAGDRRDDIRKRTRSGDVHTGAPPQQ